MQVTMGHDSICGYDGNITITIPMGMMKRLYAKARKHVGISGDDSEDLGGFFSFVKKAVHGLKKIVDNPLVKAVVGVVPYGGTAMMALDAGDKALEAATTNIKANKTVHRAAAAAAKGNPKVVAAIARLSPTERAKVEEAALVQRNAIQLAKELRVYRGALEAEGYTPRMRDALRLPRAPWNVRR